MSQKQLMRPRIGKVVMLAYDTITGLLTIVLLERDFVNLSLRTSVLRRRMWVSNDISF